jgi:hypothetical protein
LGVAVKVDGDRDAPIEPAGFPVGPPQTNREVAMFATIRTLTAATLVAAGGGCFGGPVKTELPKPDANLNLIANAYTDAVQPNGNGPADLEQLKKAIANITRVVGGNPDEVLVSPNDGLPYVIVYNAKLRGGDAPSVIAYERKGKDGKRQVVDLRRLPYYVTDDEFKKFKFPASHKPGV